jgi:hypothetical protein
MRYCTNCEVTTTDACSGKMKEHLAVKAAAKRKY